MPGVDVEVSRQLSDEMQLVADCREAVKKAEAEVDHAKGELKTAKEVLADCQEQLNAAVDAAIEAERQPTLFSGLGDDLRDAGDREQEQAPRTVESEPAAVADILAVQGEVVDAEFTVEHDRIPAGEVEGRPGLYALPPHTGASAASWRRLTLDEAFETDVDIPTEVIDAIKIQGVITCGNLADLLLAGETFGLRLIDVQAVCESIETMSENDDVPVKFSGDDEDEAADEMGILPAEESEPAGEESAPASLLDGVTGDEPEPEPVEEPKAKGRGGRRKKQQASGEAA